MTASVLMIACSIVLFFYWFRYTCLLILSAKPARDYTLQVAAANELRFLRVQDELAAAVGQPRLEALRQELERDYRLLSYLLNHVATLQTSHHWIEQRILMLDFKLMQLSWLATRKLSALRARKATPELVQTITPSPQSQ